MTGIYQIQSQIHPDRIYIGSALNLKKRWATHKCHLIKGTHHSIILKNHVNKYGLEDLSFSILEECQIDDLIIREQFYIDSLKPYFNSRKIAESNYGIKRSPETRLKLSLSHKGKPLSEEHKKKCGEALKGHITTEETRRKIGLANKGKLIGRKQSLETIEKRKKSKKWKHHTPESRKRISEGRKGMVFTTEHRQHIKDSWVLRKLKKVT